MKVFISQSNYIPWKGYFDAINEADVFVLYDDAQYTKGDWRNRNRIKTDSGLQWLSIPVQTKGKNYQKINEVKVLNQHWIIKHWKSIVHNYQKAPFFNEYSPMFEDLYMTAMGYQFLSQLNYHFLTAIAKKLEIKTDFYLSSEFDFRGNKSEKLFHICKALQATHYISGPAASSYLEQDLFHRNNMEVIWMDYTAYPEYTQLFGSFEHYVSILDLLFNTGPAATSYMKSFK